MSICIVSAATKDYFNRLYVLYKSIKQYCPDVDFHCHLINMDKNNLMEKIEDESVTISYSEINTNDNIVIRAYASNIRSKLLLENIDNYEKIFWFDADTIVRKPLDELFSYLNSKKVVILKTNSPNIRKRWKSGIIGFRKSNLCNFILTSWKKETFKNGIYKCYWSQDQKLLGTLLEIVSKKYKNEIKQLPFTYIDWEFHKESHIWVGKGDRKNSKIYVNEEKKYI